MGLNLSYKDGQTPLDENETGGLLIQSITTREELDEFEQQNIESAIKWTMVTKFKKERVLSEEFILELHRRMFCDVWSWAGEFRKTNKNLGVPYSRVRVSVKVLLGDCFHWLNQKSHSDEEIAILFKHRIVSIHCFSNGNGRHSRLMADVIISHLFSKPVFSWNRNNLVEKGEGRTNYLSAINAADMGDIQPLIDFANS
jgi:Fic-DOC domain mobile mystery protein B